MSAEQIECVVIGAGIVGLAMARALAQAGHEVIVLEAAANIGTETSSRNSEVIHAGLYHPHDSLKARFCVQGRKALYAYCQDHGIAHRRCGKILVAVNDAQVPALRALSTNAYENGVDDLEWLDTAAITALEPSVRAVAGLWSPSSGIVDTHQLMMSYWGDAESAGAVVAFHTRVIRGQVKKEGIDLFCSTGDDKACSAVMVLRARLVVNCAGLHASMLAHAIDGLPGNTVPKTYFLKGNYFTLAGKTPFRHLIYPLPEPGGLGVHVTLDLAGQVRFGPDTEPVDHIDYTVDSARAVPFATAIRTYWPDLPETALLPGYAGIRPRLVPPTIAFADFRVDGPDTHGVPGLVSLYGIESPGITASLALADFVLERLDGL